MTLCVVPCRIIGLICLLSGELSNVVFLHWSVPEAFFLLDFLLDRDSGGKLDEVNLTVDVSNFHFLCSLPITNDFLFLLGSCHI